MPLDFCFWCVSANKNKSEPKKKETKKCFQAQQGTPNIYLLFKLKSK